MTVHILRSRATPRPWWPMHEYCNMAADAIVIPDCCLCRMPADKVDCRLWTQEFPIGDLGNYQYGYPLLDEFDYSYEESRLETKCADGCGCNVKPRRRSSRHLREHWYEW